MMTAGRNIPLKRKAGVLRHIKRFVTRNHRVLMWTDSTERIRPIDDEQSPAGFQNAFDFLESHFFVFDLKKNIAQQNQINASLAQMRAVRFFDIAPNDVNVVEPLVRGLIFQFSQEILLGINCVDSASCSERSRYCKRVKPRTGAEVDNIHAGLYAALLNIFCRVGEHDIYSIILSALI